MYKTHFNSKRQIRMRTISKLEIIQDFATDVFIRGSLPTFYKKELYNLSKERERYDNIDFLVLVDNHLINYIVLFLLNSGSWVIPHLCCHP